MMVQAADRRRPDASSTPPSLPASCRRRDPPRKTDPDEAAERQSSDIVPPHGPVEPEVPARVLVLAPVLGLGIWIVILAAIF